MPCGVRASVPYSARRVRSGSALARGDPMAEVGAGELSGRRLGIGIASAPSRKAFRANVRMDESGSCPR